LNNEDLGERTVPVAISGSRHEAYALAHRLNLEARERLSPCFFTNGNFERSSLEADVVAERIFDLDILPPDPNEEGFCQWWEEHSPTWTDEQRNAVWDLFDNLRFYDVTEIPLED
jgi:hypothetical protein